MTEEQKQSDGQSQQQSQEYNPQLVEAVVEAYKSSYGQQVLRVESDVAFEIMHENVVKEAECVGRNKIIDIDYSLEQPLGQLIDELLKTEGVELWRADDPKILAEMKDAQQLNDVCEAMQNVGMSQYIFVRNPQEASVRQILMLGGLMVHINNCSMLPYTHLFLPGGDWMYKPDNWNDKLENGQRAGGLNYTRWRHMGKWGQLPKDLGKEAWDLGPKLWEEESISINVYGPHFSGKSAFVGYAINPDYNIISVYPKFKGIEGTKAFIAELGARVGRKEFTYAIDSVDDLSKESLVAARDLCAKLMCVSMDKLPGFDKYINTADYYKTDVKANIPKEE